MGVANGLATLDADVLVPEAQMPASVQGLLGAVNEGEYVGVGSRLSYIGEVVPVDSEIQLLRALIPSATYDRMRFFVTNGGSGGTRSVRLGVYSETAGEPVARVAQTDPVTINGKMDEMVSVALQSPLVVSASAFYWLAIIVDGVSGVSPKIAGTPTAAFPNFLNMRNDSSTGDTLPATLAAPTNSGGAIFYRALLNEDAI